MEMPTPCPCGNVLELDDMNTCRICKNLFCHECVPFMGAACRDCRELEKDDQQILTWEGSN